MPSTELVIFEDPEDGISSSPFEGVFETKTQREILEEMLSDPFRPYTPTEISELLGKRFRTLREAFTKLERMRLIIKDNSDSQRPKYSINNDSYRILALSFYLLAQNDDKFETDTMKKALKRYCRKEFPEMMTYPSGTILMERMIIIPEGRVPYFSSEEQTTSNNMIMEGRT
jgi:hypothetical protein